MKNYRSSIPKAALERVVETFEESGRKKKAEYVLGGEVVGVRTFHETGELGSEWPYRNGRLHGTNYRCDEPGKILSTEPYVDGLPHGVAKQWSRDGVLIGTYRMRRGTGFDLWWHGGDEGEAVTLAEARYLRHGKWHGFDWWLNEDQKSVWIECHYQEHQKHGIERCWNLQGRMKRGYPQYWIREKRVTKREYLRACREDETLPKYREIDNQPDREFPPEIPVRRRRNRSH